MIVLGPPPCLRIAWNTSRSPSGCLLFSPAVCTLLKDCAERRQNRLQKAEYDATTWSARTWLSFSVQKLSVALHRAAAFEVVHALGLSDAVDARP